MVPPLPQRHREEVELMNLRPLLLASLVLAGLSFATPFTYRYMGTGA